MKREVDYVEIGGWTLAIPLLLLLLVACLPFAAAGWLITRPLWLVGYLVSRIFPRA